MQRTIEECEALQSQNKISKEEIKSLKNEHEKSSLEHEIELYARDMLINKLKEECSMAKQQLQNLTSDVEHDVQLLATNMTQQFQSSMKNAMQNHEETQKAFLELQSKLDEEQQQNLSSKELIEKLQSSLEKERKIREASEQSILLLESQILEEKKNHQDSRSEVLKITEQCELAKGQVQSLQIEADNRIKIVSSEFQSTLAKQKQARDVAEQNVLLLQSKLLEEQKKHEITQSKAVTLTNQCLQAKEQVQFLQSEVDERIKQTTDEFKCIG